MARSKSTRDREVFDGEEEFDGDDDAEISDVEEEVFDAHAARRQGQMQNLSASAAAVLPFSGKEPQRQASDRASVEEHEEEQVKEEEQDGGEEQKQEGGVVAGDSKHEAAVGPAAGVVEDDLAVEDNIMAGLSTTENPADLRMQLIQQYQGSFSGLGNSSSGRYHVHLTVSCVSLF